MAIGKYLSDKNADGTSLGQSTSDLIALYGGTPVSQRAAAIQAASVVSASTYISVTTNFAAFCAEVAATLTAIGAWKGSA
jgi:hypothetical protein